MSTSGQGRILWIGDLDPFMDDKFLQQLFGSYGVTMDQLVNIKIIKDKNTGQPLSYGFLEFSNHDIAQQVLQSCNGKPIPNSAKSLRLNWGQQSGGGSQRRESQKSQLITQSYYPPSSQQLANTTPDYSIYVGDLDPQVSEKELFQFFAAKYQGTLGAKIIIDGVWKQSKGYGFVRFSSLEEQQRALTEMNGAQLKNKIIKTSYAQSKSNSSNQSSNANNLLADPAALAQLLAYNQLAAAGFDPMYAQQLLAPLQQQQQQQLLLQQLQSQLQYQQYMPKSSNSYQYSQKTSQSESGMGEGSRYKQQGSNKNNDQNYLTQAGNQDYPQQQTGKSNSYNSQSGMEHTKNSHQPSSSHGQGHYGKHSHNSQFKLSAQLNPELNVQTDHVILVHNMQIAQKYFG